jgi:hypothetical protein
VTATGWSWEAVDEMLLEQANMLTRYWGRFPPVHELVASYLGIGADAQPATRPEVTDEDRRRLDQLTKKWGLA